MDVYKRLIMYQVVLFEDILPTLKGHSLRLE
jgi:hypothetical protein